MDGVRPTVRVSNIPLTANAQELFDFFQASVGSVFACDIFTFRRTWKSRGAGRIQFESLEAAGDAHRLSTKGKLVPFQGAYLTVSQSFDDIVVRPIEEKYRIGSAVLHVGFLEAERRMAVLESWDSVRVGLMPDRNKIELLVEDREECYKMEIMFGDIDTTFGCSLEGTGSRAVLLKLKYAPRIYHRISGPSTTPKFRSRYHVCKEDFQFLWVRLTDFSVSCSIGQSSYFCLEIPEDLWTSEIRSSFPLFEELRDLTITKGKPLPPSILVPIICCPPDTMLEYEILFQLNSLVHAQKISYGQVNPHLFRVLSGLPKDAATMTLLKFRKLKSTCYDPLKFIQTQLNVMERHQKNPLPSNKILSTCTLMKCYRALVTPLRVYFLGPELETSNYVVRHYADHASDFLRVSFVEEDWSKLAPDAISTKTELGIFSKPYRTKIRKRIVSILQEGIQIGTKKFEFLAFSASQLRGSSVWMFASSGDVTAASIRQWMGQFDRIRSVSKCAARMGQLFSSSWQTFNVPPREIQNIPDVEVTTDGIKYCFSDGIGKISPSFAKQVAQQVAKQVGQGELSKTPSAFQIRYGGYKGVVAVDRSSFCKLSLRPSMLKFNSDNTMLCVTNWSRYLPCHLNREIICLLSTLGIQDENFEALQREELCDLVKMLTNREVALKILESVSGGDTKTAVKMLMHGYEPHAEPYLSMILRAHREFRFSGIRSKCRIFVPKGRTLIGCLDETGTLSSGQVYVRVTMTTGELQDKGNKFFEKVDDETAVVVGKLVATKNPCLHPGDIRILEAVYKIELLDKGLVDCIVFPQKGERPHPNECSGGDLDGDLYFVCWDDSLIPPRTDMPMDYIARRPRIMDHEVTLQEIQEFFIEYMTDDTLGIISTTHLVHADSEPNKARSPKCLQLANLHSMAVDFAKTGAPAEMPRILRPKEYPDFMERYDRPSYISTGILGKLYRMAVDSIERQNSDMLWSKSIAEAAYDHDLEVTGFENFLELAVDYRNQYAEKLSTLVNYYGADGEDEILTGNLRKQPIYLQKEKKRDVKDRILEVIGSLQKEVRSWFIHSCNHKDYLKMASAWYHVTYHPNFFSDANFLSFPWILCDELLCIKSSKRQCKQQGKLDG